MSIPLDIDQLLRQIQVVIVEQGKDFMDANLPGAQQFAQEAANDAVALAARIALPKDDQDKATALGTLESLRNTIAGRLSRYGIAADTAGRAALGQVLTTVVKTLVAAISAAA